MLVNGNKKNFEEEVLKAKGKVLVDFNAWWCGPCQMLKPIIEEIAKENEDLKIVSVDVDKERELAMEHQISSIPCLAVFEDGKEISREVGALPKEKILKMMGK